MGSDSITIRKLPFVVIEWVKGYQKYQHNFSEEKRSLKGLTEHRNDQN